MSCRALWGVRARAKGLVSLCLGAWGWDFLLPHPPHVLTPDSSPHPPRHITTLSDQLHHPRGSPRSWASLWGGADGARDRGEVGEAWFLIWGKASTPLDLSYSVYRSYLRPTCIKTGPAGTSGSTTSRALLLDRGDGLGGLGGVVRPDLEGHFAPGAAWPSQAASIGPVPSFNNALHIPVCRVGVWNQGCYGWVGKRKWDPPSAGGADFGRGFVGGCRPHNSGHKAPNHPRLR